MKERAVTWFKTLQSNIIAVIEGLERAGGGTETFKRKSWDFHQGTGGGTMAVLAGDVFEKAGVNFSCVQGEFSEKFRAQIPGADENPAFWASGVSVVIHPRSPHLPTIHMNTRHIITQKKWFGGGADLTPWFPVEEDTAFFHKQFEDTCNRFDPEYYPKFKKWADEYFYLPHRQEPRGIGGIFYDYVDSGDWEADFAFTQAVGTTFHETYKEIVSRHLHKPWTEEERRHQLRRRGRYVEFNLLYDRGTHFGLQTGGNTEAILMSMPPVVEWPAP